MDAVAGTDAAAPEDKPAAAEGEKDHDSVVDGLGADNEEGKE